MTQRALAPFDKDYLITMKPSLFTTAVLMAALAACSPSTTQWNKGGANAEDLRHDRDECAATSRSYDFVFTDRDSGRPGIVESGADTTQRRAGGVQGDVYRDCMERRGWRRVRGGEPVPQ